MLSITSTLMSCDTTVMLIVCHIRGGGDMVELDSHFANTKMTHHITILQFTLYHT